MPGVFKIFKQAYVNIMYDVQIWPILIYSLLINGYQMFS